MLTVGSVGDSVEAYRHTFGSPQTNLVHSQYSDSKQSCLSRARQFPGLAVGLGVRVGLGVGLAVGSSVVGGDVGIGV